jgi:hypothetical protein
MFPIHFKLTISTPEELAKVTAFIAAGYASNVANVPTVGVSADEKAAVLGKSAATTEKPAPSPRTAKAATEPAAPAKTAAAPTPAAEPAAAPLPASTAAPEAFQYDTLKKLILKLLPTHGDALTEIAQRHGQPHGATTFKSLPPECWAAAYADVQALENSGV